MGHRAWDTGHGACRSCPSTYLQACTVVVVQVGLDLALSLSAGGGLVDGQQDELVVGGHDHGVQTRVDCRAESRVRQYGRGEVEYKQS